MCVNEWNVGVGSELVRVSLRMAGCGGGVSSGCAVLFGAVRGGMGGGCGRVRSCGSCTVGRSCGRVIAVCSDGGGGGRAVGCRPSGDRRKTGGVCSVEVERT